MELSVKIVWGQIVTKNCFESTTGSSRKCVLDPRAFPMFITQFVLLTPLGLMT